MSVPGADALGHWALGHAPDAGPTTTTLAADKATYTITSFPVTFKITEAIAAASFAIAGTATAFKVTEAATTGSYAIAGKTASFTITEAISAGSFTINGQPVNEIVLEADSSASFLISTFPANLFLTFHPDQQGGVGHYKYEAELARQLAAITRRGPPGFVDLRSVPKFSPFGGQPIAPPAPAVDLQAVAQMQAAQAAKTRRRRDAEAILLLAS